MSRKIDEDQPGLVGAALGGLGRFAAKQIKGAYNNYKERTYNPEEDGKKKRGLMAELMAREWKRYAAEQNLEPTEHNLEDYARTKWGVTLSYEEAMKRGVKPVQEPPPPPTKSAPTPTASANTVQKAGLNAVKKVADRVEKQKQKQQQTSAAPAAPAQQTQATAQPVQNPRRPISPSDNIDQPITGATKPAGSGAKKTPKPRAPRHKPHPALSPHYGFRKESIEYAVEQLIETKHGRSFMEYFTRTNDAFAFSDEISQMIMEGPTDLAPPEGIQKYLDELGADLLKRPEVNQATSYAKPGSKEWVEFITYLRKNGGTDPRFWGNQQQQAAKAQSQAAPQPQPTKNIDWKGVNVAIDRAGVDETELTNFVELARKVDLNTLVGEIQKYASNDDAKRVMAAILHAYAKAYPT